MCHTAHVLFIVCLACTKIYQSAVDPGSISMRAVSFSTQHCRIHEDLNQGTKEPCVLSSATAAVCFPDGWLHTETKPAAAAGSCQVHPGARGRASKYICSPVPSHISRMTLNQVQQTSSAIRSRCIPAYRNLAVSAAEFWQAVCQQVFWQATRAQ